MPYLHINNSVAFDKYIFIFSHHENRDLEYFYHMKKLPPTTLQLTSPIHGPRHPLFTFFHCKLVLLFLGFYIILF